MNQQCLGITRSGERCKISRALIDGYCHLHRKGAAVTESASEKPPINEPDYVIPPVLQDEPAPAITPEKRNPALLIAGFVCIFLLLLIVVKKKLPQRRC